MTSPIVPYASRPRLRRRRPSRSPIGGCGGGGGRNRRALRCERPSHATGPSSTWVPTSVSAIRDVRGQFRGVLGERGGRLDESFRVDPAERVRPVRPPVDRHRQPRPDEAQRLGRLDRVEMEAAPEGRSPAPDRDERDVDGFAELAHPGEQVRVTREVDRPRAAHDEADGRRRRAERWPVARVDRGHRPDGDPAHVHALTDAQLPDVGEPVGQHPRAGPAGHDQQDVLARDRAGTARRDGPSADAR